MRKSGVPREQLFVSSKLYPTGGYESTLAACAASLERLGMEFVAGRTALAPQLNQA